MEIGLLALEEATDPEELSVGGFIGVVGESDKLSMWKGTAPYEIATNNSQNRPYFPSRLDITPYPVYMNSARPSRRLQAFIRP